MRHVFVVRYFAKHRGNFTFTFADQVSPKSVEGLIIYIYIYIYVCVCEVHLHAKVKWPSK
jgi:hypothetical protein